MSAVDQHASEAERKRAALHKQRWRRIVQATLSSGAARVVTMLANLVQVPIALHHLGTEAFGLWMVLVGTVQLMAFADLGMGLGIQNKVSEAYGRDDFQEIHDVVTTGRRVLLALGLALALITLPLVFLLDWAAIFKVTDPSLRVGLLPAMLVVIGYFAIGLPLSVGLRISTGLQMGWLNGVWAVVGSVSTLLLIWLAALLHLGFVGFIALALVPNLLLNLGLTFSIHLRTKTSLGRFKGRFITALIPPLLRQGGYFLVPQVSASIMASAPAILLASALGPAAVAPFNICQRLANSMLQIQAMPLQPLWPAYAEARSRGDVSWIRRLNGYAVIYGVLSGTVLSLGLAFFGPDIAEFWTRSSIITDHSDMLGAFAIWVFLVSLMAPLVIVMNGLGALKSQAYGGVLSSISLLLLAPVFVQSFGAIGAVVAMIVSWFLIGCPLVILEYIKLRKTFI